MKSNSKQWYQEKLKEHTKKLAAGESRDFDGLVELLDEYEMEPQVTCSE